MFHQEALDVQEESRIGDYELLTNLFELKNRLDSREIEAEEYIQRKQRIIDNSTHTHDPNFEYVTIYKNIYKKIILWGEKKLG